MKPVHDKMAVIFDLDGVLVDTSEFHRLAWFELAQNEGFEMSDEFFYKTFGMQNYQILAMLAGRGLPGDEIDRLAEWKEQRYRELAKEKLTLMSGAKELLEDLKDNGFLLAIGSSAPRANLDFVLELTGVNEYFDACVTGEDVEHGKPAPDTFLKAAERLSLAPLCCVVVEDAVQGVEAANNAGMASVAVTTTRSRADLKHADIIVDCLSELKARDFTNIVQNPNLRS